MTIEQKDPFDEGDATVRRSGRWKKVRRATILVILSVLVLLAGVMAWLDTPSGHQFVAQRIASLSPSSGLRIEIGRIDGSIYSKAVLHDVRLSDPQGVFLTAPKIRLKWWPAGWFSNRLEIDDLIVPEARLLRLPRLKPSEKDGPILPDFDIRIMQLKVDRLQVDKAVTGRADIFTIRGDADIRDGAAGIDLSVRSLKAQDRLLLTMEVRPAINRFNVDLTVNAPAKGLLATLAGLKRDVNVRMKGQGNWKWWNGRLSAMVDGQSAAGITVNLREGNAEITGNVEGSAFGNSGLLGRLSSPRIAITGKGTYADKLLSGQLMAESGALAVDLNGGIHLGGQGYDNLVADISLRRPSALLKNFDARGLVSRLRLNGPFSTASFEYLLRADRLRFGKTLVHGVHAAGKGRSGGKGKPTLIPIDFSATRVDGQGDIIAQVLRNISVRGTLQKLGDRITSAPLRLRSDQLNGELIAMFDLGTGRYDLALAGDIKGLSIPGLGVVDLRSKVRAVPGARGGFTLAGQVDAGMRRLDNSFLSTLSGGPPRLRSNIQMGPDGRLQMKNLSLRSPLLRLDGAGVREADGTVRITGTGRHVKYGPLKLTLTGNLARPGVDLLLQRPLDAAGLANVHVVLNPDAQGYRYRATGGSTLGPFESEGRIDLPSGGDAVIVVDRLRLNGGTGQGRLLVVPGGLAGRLVFSGNIRGTVDLSVEGGVQKAVATLRVDNAHFGGATSIDVNRARLDATLLLRPDGTIVDARIRGGGLQVGRMRLNRFSGSANLVNGTGKVSARLVGQRGRQFNLLVDADVAPDEIRFAIDGTLDGQRISLDRHAVARRVEGGWALDPVTLRYRGGSIRFDRAEFGSAVRIEAGLARMPLSTLDLANVDLGLGGVASGKLYYHQPRGQVATGTASFTIKGLTRSGLTRTSTPIDLGINAELTTSRLAIRAVAAQNGTVIGRGQALMTPLGPGSLIERLRAAPVRSQIRFNGPADTLWRLSTIEIVDLRGKVALSADISGTGANPVISGRLMTRDAVLESPITGMRLSNLRSRAQFDGSLLIFSELSGTTANGGTVSGRGSFDFSLGEGIGIDLAFQADNAELLDRDDIGATVNGPLSIRSDGKGGTISGDFDVVRSRFMLGRAAEVAEIPQLKVIEKNRRADEFEQPERGVDWRLDIKAKARNRLAVRGMGLTSEWRMDLDIGGSVANPRILGRADLVRGSYDFAGRRFDLTAGALRFDGSVPANPTLDITAQATVSGFDATIRITGTSAAPEISFSSNPALPQEEILSRILFGSSITQLSAPEALQLAAAVGSLQGGGGGGLDPINAVRKAAGLDRLRILPADPTTGQGTSIGAGKYLTRRIYVELISDGQGYSATRLEYQVTRWLSLLGAVSTIGRQSVAARVSKDY